jgi:hypothetical protein
MGYNYGSGSGKTVVWGGGRIDVFGMIDTIVVRDGVKFSFLEG